MAKYTIEKVRFAHATPHLSGKLPHPLLLLLLLFFFSLTI
jgi:hypothetical protein